MKKALIITGCSFAAILLAVTAPDGKRMDEESRALSGKRFGPLRYDEASSDRISLSITDVKGPATGEAVTDSLVRDALAGDSTLSSPSAAVPVMAGPIIMKDPRNRSRRKDKEDGSLLERFENSSLTEIEDSLLNDFTRDQSWGWLADEVLSTGEESGRNNRAARRNDSGWGITGGN